tara:strand:- start:285 stop:809 length:525 start_codon:yes stop_codon:yes gene_type:complete
MSQIKVDSIVPSGGLPSGSNGGIVQIKSATKTDTFSNTSTSFTDITDLSVSITPRNSSNKILVSYNLTCGTEDSTYHFGIRLVRDSTAIFVGDAAGSREQVSNFVRNNGSDRHTVYPSGQHLDSPGTTSSVTYKLQIVGYTSGRALHINKVHNDTDDNSIGRSASSITVMEVSG